MPIDGEFSQISLFGEDIQSQSKKTRNEVLNDYDGFVDKFKPKLTTDDCYTPAIVYNAIADWVAREYGLNRENFVRPFYPNGDYKSYKYAPDCVVVDNPPFSILSEIRKYYMDCGIKYFLFAPSVTTLSADKGDTAICVGCSITYDNGAKVCTSFCTNLENSEILLRSAPDLHDIVKRADEENRKEVTKQMPKYKYPPQVITAAMVNYMSIHGQQYQLKRSDCVRIQGGTLDAQRQYGKGVFGGGYLLSEKAAAEKAAAEKAAAEKAAAEKAAAEKAAAEKAAAIEWKLSEREKQIISMI